MKSTSSTIKSPAVRVAAEEEQRRERAAKRVAEDPTVVPGLRFGREIMEPLRVTIEALRDEVGDTETELDARLQTPLAYDDERASEVEARLAALKARLNRHERRYTLLKIFEDESPQGGPVAGHVVFRLSSKEREILGFE